MIDTIIASLSLMLSLGLAFFYIRDRRQARFLVENDYINYLATWHGQVVGVLIRASHQDLDRESIEHRSELATLSALIEQGRFFFPNIKNAYGSDKPPAYRGHRNLALDFLVAAYNLLKKEPTLKNKAQLELLQKYFTSVVFEIVQPEQRLKTIKALTNRYFIEEKSFEDFLKHRDESILDHIWKNRY